MVTYLKSGCAGCARHLLVARLLPGVAGRPTTNLEVDAGFQNLLQNTGGGTPPELAAGTATLRGKQPDARSTESFQPIVPGGHFVRRNCDGMGSLFLGWWKREEFLP